MSDGFGRNYFWRENREWKDLRREFHRGGCRGIEARRLGNLRYMRRIGRSARMLAQGLAHSLFSWQQYGLLLVRLAHRPGAGQQYGYALVRVAHNAAEWFRRFSGMNGNSLPSECLFSHVRPLQAWEKLSRGGAWDQLKTPAETAKD